MSTSSLSKFFMSFRLHSVLQLLSIFEVTSPRNEFSPLCLLCFQIMWAITNASKSDLLNVLFICSVCGCMSDCYDSSIAWLVLYFAIAQAVKSNPFIMYLAVMEWGH